MAKRISSKDIFAQEDIFKGIRDSAKLTKKKRGRGGEGVFCGGFLGIII